MLLGPTIADLGSIEKYCLFSGNSFGSTGLKFILKLSSISFYAIFKSKAGRP